MIQNQWYIGCASSQLTHQLVSAQLLGQPVVLFRDSQGLAKALLDRCCHRGFPLSKSKLVNGKIECGYHGWQYDRHGQVVHIPSQAAEKTIPKSFCVRSFVCEEKDGYIWIWAGNEAPTPVPEFPEIQTGHWLQGSRKIECNYMRALEITYDGSHLYFLHPTHPATIAAAKYGFGENAAEVRTTEKGCLLTFPPPVSEDEPPAPYEFTMEFVLPGHIIFKAGGKAFMYFFTMPLSETSCQMHWTISAWEPSSERIRWTGEGAAIIEEDQLALELVQKTYEREGESFERSVEADTAVLLLRRIVRAAEQGKFNANDFPAARKVFKSIGAARA